MRYVQTLGGLIATIYFYTSLLSYAQPVIQPGGAVNAASYRLSGLPGSALAPGSIFLVFGNGLGPDQLVQVQDWPLPTELAGTSVQVIANGQTYPCYILYTSAKQVAALLPSNVPVGPAQLRVIYNGQASADEPVEIARHGFGLFTRNQAGYGPATAQNVTGPGAMPQLNGLTRPAHHGSMLVLWGTGLGPVQGDEAGQPLPGQLPYSVRVYIGGQWVTPTYSGRSGCCAGVDQIIVEIPEGIQGCYVPVAVEVEGVLSNFTTVAIAPPGHMYCSSALSFTREELEKLSSGGTRLGTLQLGKMQMQTHMGQMMGFGQTLEMHMETATAVFARWGVDDLETLQAVPLDHVNSCTVSQFWNDENAFRPIPRIPLDAGPRLELRGPQNTVELVRWGAGVYRWAQTVFESSGVMPGPGFGGPFSGGGFGMPGMGMMGFGNANFGAPFLTQGNYTLAVPGDSDVRPFLYGFTLPAPVEWINKPGLEATVPRNQDLLIQWTGGAPGQLVYIFGSASSEHPRFGMRGTSFVCFADATLGSFVVPRDILEQLPAHEEEEEPGHVDHPHGWLGVGSYLHLPSIVPPGLESFWGTVFNIEGTAVDFE